MVKVGSGWPKSSYSSSIVLPSPRWTTTDHSPHVSIEVLAPLPMTQLQTDYITKTMVRKSYAASSSSNSNIGHHNLPITTGAADTTTLMIVTMVTTMNIKVHTIVKSTMVVALPPPTTMKMMMTRYHP